MSASPCPDCVYQAVLMVDGRMSERCVLLGIQTEYVDACSEFELDEYDCDCEDDECCEDCCDDNDCDICRVSELAAA